MAEPDPFWNDEAEVERAKQPWTWPRAFAEVGTNLILAVMVVAIVYLIVSH